jgi:4-hydroxybutyryl-CoA dehydratase/vinylacetyl-CoA-Delta-isomerase
MKREIWRNYPVMEKADLVEKLLDRGILDEGRRVSKQPGRCCATGCEVRSLWPTALRASPRSKARVE